MKLELLSEQDLTVSNIDVPDAIFDRVYNEALVHQVVVAFQANGRQGTRSQLDRTLVKHSTKKPWRQKGTGRARAGMTSSPLWRGGGRVFPNTPDENFSQKINKKMYRAGMSAIFSQLVRENRLKILDSLTLSSPKTKLLVEKLKCINLNSESLLIITDQMDENLYLASRNLLNVSIIEFKHIDPVSLVKYENTLIMKNAIKNFEEVL
jgi:large subunit ribosomal protein L4